MTTRKAARRRKPAPRAAMGRPSKYPGKDPRPLCLSLRTTTKEYLQRRADRLGSSVSDVVDGMAEAAEKAEGKGA